MPSGTHTKPHGHALLRTLLAVLEKGNVCQAQWALTT